MEIRGIAKGDKDLRHFTFDDGDYTVRAGVYYYKVNYGKNKLEGEYGEDEIGFVECDKVIPLGGKKPKPIPGREKTNQKEIVYGPSNLNDTTPVVEKPKRGRPPKVTKQQQVSNETIPVSIDGSYKYEYYVAELKVNDAMTLQNELNELGSEGWELCCYDVDKSLFSNVHIRAIFKRKRA